MKYCAKQLSQVPSPVSRFMLRHTCLDCCSVHTRTCCNASSHRWSHTSKQSAAMHVIPQPVMPPFNASTGGWHLIIGHCSVSGVTCTAIARSADKCQNFALGFALVFCVRRTVFRVCVLSVHQAAWRGMVRAWTLRSSCTPVRYP